MIPWRKNSAGSVSCRHFIENRSLSLYNDFFSLNLLLVYFIRKFFFFPKMNIQCDGLWFIPWFIHPFSPSIFPLWNMKQCKYLTICYGRNVCWMNIEKVKMTTTKKVNWINDIIKYKKKMTWIWIGFNDCEKIIKCVRNLSTV